MDKKKKRTEISDKVQRIISMQSSVSDPNGSYTGVPENPNETPVQDADDL